jgi:hypothetical protein
MIHLIHADINIYTVDSISNHSIHNDNQYSIVTNTKLSTYNDPPFNTLLNLFIRSQNETEQLTM